MAGRQLDSSTAPAKRQAEANLHKVVAAHAGEDGVLLGSGAWIVTARR